jgi:sialic acid synthase SpsE/mannose-6-phosphate isomerase-like protein (cupin superfamily)
MNKLFENLYVLDIANNHFGDVKHGLNIINQFSKIIKKHKLKATFKFQFRDLDTFIHKSELNNKENHFVKRFLDTRLDEQQFKKLLLQIKKENILTSCTPFDEKSVDLIEKLKFDIIKIASVSSNDFSLLSRVSKNNIPKIISTGGLSVENIDKIVSFMNHRRQIFSLMHCVAIYPTEVHDMNLRFINTMKKRYKNITIGWSTHEDPTSNLPGILAYAMGARMFEKHIGIRTKKYKLNNYSVTPNNFHQYLENMNIAKNILGNGIKNKNIQELNTLKKLDRGVYIKKDVRKGDALDYDNIYFAFPLKPQQLSATEFTNKFSAEFNEGVHFKKSIASHGHIKNNDIVSKKFNINKYILKKSIHRLKAMLNENKIEPGSNFDLEVSHHYGLKKFDKYGCFLFNIINKQYCKKILVMFPNQKHPLHFHKRKEETFHILSGELVSILDKKKHKLFPGDLIDVKPGTWHEFYAGKKGCIFEEVSTTSYENDSFYQDQKIQSLKREERKTSLKSWGRFEV